MSRSEDLARSLARVQDRIVSACRACGRDPGEVSLVAVSKTWPAADVALLRELQVHDFGENRDQEARAKAAAVPDVRWHFVGTVQRNKASSIATYADVVHTLDRPALVPALSTAADRAGRQLRVLVQVSLDGDPARGGALPADVPALAAAAAAAPALLLGGVMAVAPREQDPAAAFHRLAQVAAALRSTHPEAGDISAGMSGDLDQAVAAGATHVRVGTALFGSRPPVLR